MILRGQKLGNNTSKHINANVCKNDRTCACTKLSFYLLYVNENAQKMVTFVVKRYAVREAEKWRYAVRKGGGGCHPHVWKHLLNTVSCLQFVKITGRYF